VYAAGDCVAPMHMVTEKPTPMPFALPSNRMGRVAGDNIAASFDKGQASHFPGVLGTAVTQVFGLGLATTGLTEEAARAHDYEAAVFMLESRTKAEYMPDVGDMALKLVANAENGKLLGCQVVGPAESVLR